MDYTNPFLNPTGAVTDNVVGSGGSVRHVGNFTEDNTYYQQLKAIEENGGYGATNNQDLDALYERAIEEQARLDNLAMTEELNWRKLQEQREYDSDVQRVARARAAGINPDLAGGSGSSSGGSSALMPATEIAPVQGQTKFGNAYDNASLVMQGINTASSLLTSIGGFATSVVDNIAKIKKLPVEFDILETQSYVAKETADNVISLSDKSVQQADLNLASSELANMSSSLRLLGDLGSYITPNTSNEDALSTFAMLGFDEATSKKWLPRLRQYQDTPAYQADLENAERRRRNDSVYNDIYSTDFLTELMDIGRKIQMEQSICQQHRAVVDKNIAEMLALSPTYATDLGKSMIQGAENDKQNAIFQATKLTESIFAYSQRVQHSVEAVRDIDKAIQEIRTSDNGIDSTQKSAIIRGLMIKRNMLLTSGLDEFNNVYDLINAYNSQLFLSQFSALPGGTYNYVPDNLNTFNQINFGQFYNGSVSYSAWRDNLLKHLSFAFDKQFKMMQLDWDMDKFYDNMRAEALMNTQSSLTDLFKMAIPKKGKK